MEFTDDQTNCELEDKSEPKGMKQTVKALNQSLLHSEIGFWREMLLSSDAYTPAASIERMKHALALAERKLNELLRHYQDGVRTIGQSARAKSGRGAGNVHYLSRKSGSPVHSQRTNSAKFRK